jgi:hypothetical protein
LDAESGASFSHPLKTGVSAVEALWQTVHDAPLLVLKVSRFSMLDLTMGIVLPEDLFGFSVS